MKTQFAEFYDLPDFRIKEIWDDALIVFDTNVLLNLYRYKEDASDEFMKVIEFYKERLWIPYQVGFEFHRRRDDILRKNAAAYKALSEKISEQLLKVIDALDSDARFARHPYIQMGDFRKKVKKCASSISKSLEKQEKSHPDFAQKDKILDAVTFLFDGHVGGDLAENELDTLYKEGEKRYANQVPPGYCDAKSKKDQGNRSLYGDLIVWIQTIKHSSDQKRNIIFVTDDHKQDWWDKVEGKHTPRKELIKEFRQQTECDILIYDSSRFLEYAKQNKELKVSKKTINEVSKVKLDDLIQINKYLNPELYVDNKNYLNYLYTGINSPYSTLVKTVSESPLTVKALTDPFNEYYRIIGDTVSPFRDIQQELYGQDEIFNPYIVNKNKNIDGI